MNWGTSGNLFIPGIYLFISKVYSLGAANLGTAEGPVSSEGGEGLS